MTINYTDELTRYFFANRDKFFQSQYRGKDPVMSLITTLLPLALIILIIALVGFLFVLRQVIKHLAKGLEYIYYTCVNKYKAHKQEQETKKQQQAEQQRQQNELKESTDIYDKSVLELRRLIKNNFNHLNVSVLRTGERKKKKYNVYTWVTFTVYDIDKKQVVSVNDLVNNVCYRMLEVSRKDGEYLKGSLIFPYADYMELENRLRVLLQMNFTITLN